MKIVLSWRKSEIWHQDVLWDAEVKLIGSHAKIDIKTILEEGFCFLSLSKCF